MFTDNKLLEAWLTEIADVEPRPGGKYELFWDRDDRENNSTTGCRITAIEENKFLAFDWKGPTQFKHFMNTIVPLTHIVVFFLPCTDGNKPCTEIHLVHSGWGDSAEWEEAREWFEKAWKAAFVRLEKSITTS
jgi:uncharacterized protein YndB with AHSA1/START domain